MRSLTSPLGGLLLVFSFVFPGISATRPAISTERLPLVFERNQGQAPSKAEYLAHAGNSTLLLTNHSVQFTEPGRHTIEMTWENGEPTATPAAENPQASYSNYYLGRDPQQWYTHIAHFGAIRYRN